VEFATQNVPHAVDGTAAAGILPIILQVIAIIEGDLLADGYGSQRHNPDLSLD
jgi:hypothetical protein